MSDPQHRSDKAEALASHAARLGFAQWFIMAFEPDGKWVATVSNGFDLERMKEVRNWLDRQINEEKSSGNEEQPG